MKNRLALLTVLTASALLGNATTARTPSRRLELWRQVEILRTANGVPHIRAENLRAAGYALAWLQSEDYGPRTAMNVLRARGQMARLAGREYLESDFEALRSRDRALRTYPLLAQATRDVYEGFAAGLNRYIELYAQEFPPSMPADFTGSDVATLDVRGPSYAAARRFLDRLPLPERRDTPPGIRGNGAAAPNSDEGSNAWAFAPSRTKSGKAILLRNPHLSWGAGYYEAHVTVPRVLDFYGDFRIGGVFGVVGGFNRDLGWATTNSSPRDQNPIYALDIDPKAADHYLFDGASHPLTRELRTVEFRDGDRLLTQTREIWSTPLGPVIYRGNGKVYVLKSAGDGDFRVGEQYLRMIRASSLGEWKEAMKIRGHDSNFLYADRAGNIFYLWDAALPLLPHPSGGRTPPSDAKAASAAPLASLPPFRAGDAIATPARASRDVWTRYVPFEALPHLLNPRGGYLHNENDSPHFTNVRGPIDTRNAYPNFEPPRLSLRSQLAIELIGGDDKVTLEDVVRLKHSYRMLLADRVKPDLIAAVKATNPTGEVAAAVALLERWNDTAAPESQGAALFEVWWQHYSGLLGPERRRLPAEKLFARVWSVDDPLQTPRGLADPARAAESFAWAVAETARRYGRWDIAWGDVHRVRRGPVDVPVGGGSAQLGCFRVLGYARDTDGKLAANFGDGWILAVEFGDVPRAYSVLAYGESSRPDSPWYADQAEMFAKGELKKVAFTRADVDAQAVLRYRPGEKRDR